MKPDATLIEVRAMKQADTFDLRRLREGFGADSGFTDAQLLAGLTVPAILDSSRRSIGPADPTPAPYRPSRAAKMAA
jgi:hypothetical protein